MAQLTHYNSKFKEQEFPIVLVCEQVTNAPNIGSLFRTADAFGVKELILCGEHIHIGRKIKKTSRATEKNVAFKIEKDITTVVLNLKKKDYWVIALEITDNSKAISQHNFSSNNPIALVLGSENDGISEAVLNIADSVVHINMYGKNSSMNVVQAANIALYEITSQIIGNK